MKLNRDAILAETQPGHRQAIETLLEDETPQYEILRAAITGDLDRTLELLMHDRRVLDVEWEEWTPVRLAVRYGTREVARRLLDEGAEMGASATGFQTSLLHLATARGCPELITLLLERGADPSVINVNGETPVFYARDGDSESIAVLLKGGAHPDTRDRYDQTLLQKAASDGHIAVVKVLLDFGADVNARHSALTWAWSENPDRWPLLNEPTGARPLYGAVCCGSTKLVNLLLNAGADINALSFGWSALHAATARPNPEMAEFLLDRAADLFLKSADGRTPIELLAGHRRSAELLRAALGVKSPQP